MSDEDKATPVVDPLDSDEDLESQLAYENLKRRREARRRRRIIVVAAALMALVVAVIVYSANMADDADSDSDGDVYAATGEVYRGDFLTTVSANGAAEPLSSVVVTPEVDGIIENLQVSEGSFVNAGDMLFSLKNDSLDKAVREASVQIDSAQRALDSAQRAVDDAYAAYNREWQRCNAAEDWSSFDEAALRSAIATAEASRDEAAATLENARTALAETQATADKRTVLAPVSGNVVAMNAVNGAAVGSATGGTGATTTGPLMQIADLSQMKVIVQVNEIDIASIAPGQQAHVTFSALPGVELDATVQRIASTATGSSEGSGFGVVTYAVELLIPQPDQNLKPGMTATVSIITQNVPDTLMVPAAAIWEDMDDDGSVGATTRYVSVLLDEESGESRDVAVRVIAENNSEAAVEPVEEDELEDGDLVVIADETEDMSYDEGKEESGI